MKVIKRFISFMTVVLVIGSSVVLCSAHSGRTDANGGHYDRKTGVYHYHHSSPSHKQSSDTSSYKSKSPSTNIKPSTPKKNSKATSEEEFFMLIFCYIALGLFIMIYQLCFMFSPKYLHAKGIGNVFLFLSLILVIPIIILGGWIHLLWYILFSVVCYIVFLLLGGMAWRRSIRKCGIVSKVKNHNPKLTSHPPKVYGQSKPSSIVLAPPLADIAPSNEQCLSVAAPKLLNDFIKDKVKAKQFYNGRTLKITGIVENISEDYMHDVCVALDSETEIGYSVQCTFKNRDEISKISSLRKGNTVTIVGKFEMFFLGVHIEDCILFDPVLSI